MRALKVVDKRGSLPFPVKFGKWDTPANTTREGKQVWVYIGDSIAQGTNQGTDTGPPVFYANTVRYWNPGSSDFVSITTNDIGGALAGSAWVKFGTDYYKRTGYQIDWVSGGTGGANYFPDGDTNNFYDYVVQWNNVMISVANALAFHGLREVRGVIYLCGINDARASQDQSAINKAIFLLVSKTRKRLNGAQQYFINIGRDENGNGEGQRVQSVRKGIEDVCNYFSDCHIILRLGDLIVDPDIYSDSFADVHPNQFGYDYIGAKAVKNMLDGGLISNTPRKYTYTSNTAGIFKRLHGLTEDEKRAIHDFVEYLVSISSWNMDSFVLPLFSQAGNCYQDWLRDVNYTGGLIKKNRGGIETVGTLGSSINTNFTPSVDGVNYTQNLASVGCFLLKNNNPTGADHYLFGCRDATRLLHLRYAQATNDKRWIVNAASQGTIATGLFKKNTLYAAVRTTSNSQSMIENYQSIPSVVASVGLPTRPIYFGSFNDQGTVNNFYKGVFGAFFIGGVPASTNNSFYKKVRELVVDFLIMD
jgi:hypothetical protein